MFRAMTNRLTYANVVATLALFVGLGGASYAAISIPAHSVGTRQLREGSVAPADLGFPLVTTGAVNRHPIDLMKTPCDSPPPPGKPIMVDCPAMKLSGITTPGRELHLNLRSRGRVFLSTVTGLQDQGSPGTTVTVKVALIVDGRVASQNELLLSGGQATQSPGQLVTSLSAGEHTFGLEASARYSSSGPGDVIVSPVSLAASAFPI